MIALATPSTAVTRQHLRVSHTGDSYKGRWHVDRNRLVVTGDIDSASASALHAGFVHAIHDRSIDTVDLSGISLFSSAAIRVLQEFELHRRMTVISNRVIDQVLEVVDPTHLEDLRSRGNDSENHRIRSVRRHGT